MKIAAVGDLHVKTDSSGLVRDLLHGVDAEADVLALAGDLTNFGMPEEMSVLLRDLDDLRIPIIAVIGNHDHESDAAEQLVAMMQEKNICVLECTSCEIDGVGFVGTKGFCGGFGKWCVSTFGERSLKSFVFESIDESERLAASLSSLTTRRKVALLHYSPIRETLKGESEEIYAFLGTSRLADVLDRYAVDVAFHGHAHEGSPEGFTEKGTKVFNVSRQVRSRHTLSPYHVIEI